MKKINIPSKVKIGGVVYEVNQQKADSTLIVEPCSYCHGEIIYKDSLINLNIETSEDYRENTLVHEIVHGILACIGEDELCSNEKFVNAFGNCLYQVLKDNKLYFGEEREND